MLDDGRDEGSDRGVDIAVPTDGWVVPSKPFSVPLEDEAMQGPHEPERKCGPARASFMAPEDRPARSPGFHVGGRSLEEAFIEDRANPVAIHRLGPESLGDIESRPQSSPQWMDHTGR
jgi:hypothetical protein